MPIQFGVIGVGKIAQVRHLPELAANPECRIVAVADPVKVRAEEIAQKYHATAYTDHKTLLANPEIDAVVVCTPNALHAPQTIDALKAGKHVLCEKPMATSRQDAQAMIAAAGKSGKMLMIGHNQRLMPAHKKAKALLAEHRIGRVFAFRTAFQHAGPDAWSIEPATFFDAKMAVLGVCADLGIHKADLMRYLLGEEFAEVGGIVATLEKKGPDGNIIKTDDNAFLTLRTQSGVVGSIQASWTNYGDPGYNFTVFYGDKGVMLLEADPEYNVVINYKDGAQEKHRIDRGGGAHQTTSSGVADMFIKSIRENKQPEIDGVEGYKSLNVILTAMEAAREGRMLKIDHQMA